MAFEEAKKHLQELGVGDRIVVFEESTATVEEAAEQHGVDPDQIAKTLAFRLEDRAILIVASGKSRVDNKKYKGHFSKKPKMLTAEEVMDETGHAVGGVCPFGLKKKLEVYLDISLRKHETIIPAAGSKYASIPLTIKELEEYSNCRLWVDVCVNASK